MAQVRITHKSGSVDEITTSGATQEIQVQQGDKIEVLNAAFTSATVDGNNYVVTVEDPDGATVQITFVDLFLLLAVGDPTTSPADEVTSLFIGETEIASIGDALGAIAPAAGTGGDGQPLGQQPLSGGAHPPATTYEASDLGTEEAPKGPIGTDLPSDEFPSDETVTPDDEEPPAPEISSGPVAIDDFNAVTEDGGFNESQEEFGKDTQHAFGNVLTGESSSGENTVPDSDPEGDPLIVSNVSSSAGGSVTPDADGEFIDGDFGELEVQDDGSYIYWLNNDLDAVQELGDGESLTDVFTYTIDDGNGGTATATLTIHICGTNDRPIVVDDTNWAQEDGADASGNVLMDAAHNGAPDNVDRADNEDTDQDANDVLTVTGASHTNGNDDFDATGDFVVTGDFGELTIKADGSYDYVVNDAAVQGLDDLETETEVFTYQVTDGNVATTASLTITIFGTNDAPVVNADTNWAKEAVKLSASGNVLQELAHDGAPDAVARGDVADTDADATDTLEVTGASHTNTNSDSTADGSGDFQIAGDFGDLTLNEDGSYDYALNNGLAAVQALGDGETLTETYTYSVTDGTETLMATLTITIFGTNDPVLARADTNWAQEDGPDAGGNVLQNVNHPGAPLGAFADVSDKDLDANDTLEVTAITYHGVDGSLGTAGDNVVGTVGDPLVTEYGTLTLNTDGSYTFIVDDTDPVVQALADGATLTEVFTYDVSDGNGGDNSATLTITIFGTNDGPGAQGDTNWAQEDGSDAMGNVLMDASHNGAPDAVARADNEDTDPDGDTLTVSGVSHTNGNSDVTADGSGDFDVAGDYGQMTINEDGSYDYVLNDGLTAVQELGDGETLTETFTYTNTDGGTTAMATLTITIFGTNDAPVVNADTNWAQEDSSDASGNVLQTLAHNGAPDAVARGDVADTDADATDTLEVTGASHTNTNSDSTADGSGDFDIAGDYGQLTLNEDGTYDYVLNNSLDAVQELGDGETLTETYTYSVTDGTTTEMATLTITIFGTNDDPVSNADTNWAQEDSSDASGNVLQTLAHNGAPDAVARGDVADTDADDALTVTGASHTNTNSDSTADGSGDFDIAGDYGQLTLNEDGTYDYVLNNSLDAVQELGDGDTLTETYTYSVTDGTTTEMAALTITIFGTNDDPVVAADQTLWVPSDTSWQTGDFANGYPVLVPLATDIDGDALTMTFDVSGLSGQLWYDSTGDGVPDTQIDGTTGSIDADFLDDLFYIPTSTLVPDGEGGMIADTITGESFTYTVDDGNGGTDTGTINVEEVPPNDLPGLNTIIGGGSSPLTSGNDHEGSVFLTQEFLDVLQGGNGAMVALATDYQESPFDTPIPADERGLLDASALGFDFGIDVNGDGLISGGGSPDVFFNDGFAPTTASGQDVHAATAREAEVAVTLAVIGATATIAGLGTIDAVFSIVEADDEDENGSVNDPGDTLDVDWVYNPATGLMEAVVDFDTAFLVDAAGNPVDVTGQAIDTDLDGLLSFNEWLATPEGLASQTVGTEWEFTYTDNDGGNYQARFVEIDVTFEDPGDLGITVPGTAGVDVIYGTDAGDSLSGMASADIIEGRGGDDTINGGAGDDQITGGAGSDSFVYDGSSDIAASIDTILDFGAGDTFDFSGLAGDLGDITFDNSGSGGDVVVYFGGDSVAELDGITGTASVAGGSTIDEVALTIV